jgi:hypothetical protein
MVRCFDAPLESVAMRSRLMRQFSLLLAIIALLVAVPSARPFKSPVIDGTITGDGTDWDYDDLAVDDPLGDTAWGPNDIDNLWVTYDAQNLYVGIRYQVSDNAMLVLIDAGTGTGASNINTLDWYPRNFNFPDSLKADYIIANWNGSPLGVRRITSNTATVDITGSCQTANQPKGDFFYEGEVKIPWDAVYQLGVGRVMPSARVRLVALIAGGDHWNGPDSAPDNPGMNGAGTPTTLYNFFIEIVDRNGDGYPDGFIGAIEGTVGFEDPADHQTVATVKTFRQDTGALIDQVETSGGGGSYRVGRLPDRAYRVEASARGYARSVRSNLAVSGQDTLRNVDFLLAKAGKITGLVVFRDGPGRPATVAAYDSVTGDLAGEGAVTIPATGGAYELLVPDGTYRVVAEAQGYVPDTVGATITGSDSIGVDTLSLGAVRATKIVLIDDAGTEISSIGTTVSFPDSGIYFYAHALIEARDALDRRDYFNLDGYLSHVNLRATKLNNVTPPRGTVGFFTVDTTSTTFIALAEGRGEFLAADDSVEVLRVFTETATGGVAGRFKLGVRSAEPEYVALQKSAASIVADGTAEVLITARLLDASFNPVRIAGVPVSFSFASSSTGKGAFKIPSALTSGDGQVTTALTATGTGALRVIATATYLNKDLASVGESGQSYVEITALPGPPAAIRISSDADVVGFGEQLGLGAQLVDANGNAVREGGYSVTFASRPSSAGTVSPATVALDQNGQARTTFTAASERSAVAISGTSSPSLPINEITFLIDRILAFTDPKAPEPTPPHSLKDMDLTLVTIGNDRKGLEIKVKFASGWDGVHLGVILETLGNAAGAPGDPFGFPISYGHADKPEYALIYKYSTNDYADFRKWDTATSQWVWWIDTDQQYSATWADGANIKGAWIARDTAYVTYRIPFTIFGGAIPASVRAEVYLMQEVDVKRSAFDSSPSDSTLNLDFDPLDPNVDWSVTTRPVTLYYYSSPYAINTNFPPPPALAEPKASPATVPSGSTTTFTVRVTDAGGGIGNVLIDLSPIGGPRFQPLSDDGTGGDEISGDGVYSYRYLVDPDIAGGDYTLVVTGKDSLNISSADTTIALTVEGASTVIRTITDELDDDHGPNQFGKDGLYYLYPTNSVFFRRAFDLEEVTIFETSKIVAGEIIPSLAFQVRIGDLPNPTEPGAANWNPLYAGINIQKVDIHIDAFKGGATEGLPSRQNDFAKWNAWDYAIVMEGWYKAVIASNNQNTPQAWASTVRKSDRDIILTTDFARNTITAIVSKESLGNPTRDDILKWNIMVVMTSHDGDSNDNTFGGTRWVDASVSEWRLGGGNDSDRDANIIDLIASPGLGKKPGRDQSALLDYKTAEAVSRLEKGLTAVELEMTGFEDQGPPVISPGALVNETVRFSALINSPLYYTAVITDDDEVARATFHWRADSSRSAGWMGELPMGYATGDVWSVDLPIDEITAKVPVAALDSTRNIEFVITAEDPSGNLAVSPLYTMEIPKPARYFRATDLDLRSDTTLTAPEGTIVRIPSAAIPAASRETPYTYTLFPRYLSELPLPPHQVTSINVIRTISLDVTNIPDEPSAAMPAVLEAPIEIALHYPQYSVPGMNENLLAVYELNPITRTWVYIGGNVNPFGNLVTVSVRHTGTFGIFFDPSAGYNPGDVFSGVVFSPNPFSPNSDGVYDETNISFYLSKEATVTIEIFNIDGDRVKILEQRFPFTAEDTPDRQPRRIVGMTWDGRDNSGRVVPYGIYIARFTVTFSQAAGQRTIRTNAAVAVIQ